MDSFAIACLLVGRLESLRNNVLKSKIDPSLSFGTDPPTGGEFTVGNDKNTSSCHAELVEASLLFIIHRKPDFSLSLEMTRK